MLMAVEGGLALVVVAPPVPPAKPRVRLCLFQPEVAGAARVRVALELARLHKCQKAVWYGVLAAGSYQLFTAEAPEVDAAEMAQAMRWRMKDRLEFPAEEAVVEVFSQPPGLRGGRQPQVYVVAARETVVQECVTLFQGAKLALQVIDITELALRNLVALTPDNAEGLALLTLWGRQSLVMVVRGGELVMARGIEQGWEEIVAEVGGGNADREALLASSAVERISLEVQRTLNYYESYFSHLPVSCLYLAPLAVELPRLREALAEKLGMRVKELVVGELVELPAEEPSGEVLARCLVSLGAALRQEADA